jgi:hypothetical protein
MLFWLYFHTSVLTLITLLIFCMIHYAKHYKIQYTKFRKSRYIYENINNFIGFMFNTQNKFLGEKTGYKLHNIFLTLSADVPVLIAETHFFTWIYSSLRNTFKIMPLYFPKLVHSDTYKCTRKRVLRKKQSLILKLFTCNITLGMVQRMVTGNSQILHNSGPSPSIRIKVNNTRVTIFLLRLIRLWLPTINFLQIGK